MAEDTLTFLSTQIQSRYEDHNETEKKSLLLQKFKLESPLVQLPQQKQVKRRPLLKKQAKKKNTSLSAFVRETLGATSKNTDLLSILDYFRGDQTKVDEFLGKIEKATAKPHPLSKQNSSTLFSEKEWKELLDKIQLRFPNLSKKNRKTLKTITRRIREMNEFQSLEPSQELQLWTQASRQPSDTLSAEELKWLYDLDENQVLDENSSELHEENEPELFFVTLSQVLDERIANLESEPEEIDMEKYSSQPPKESPREKTQTNPLATQKTTQTQENELISLHQANELLNVLTSLAFAPTFKSEEISKNLAESTAKLGASGDVSVFSSPTKPERHTEFKTPQHWPANLVITSSPNVSPVKLQKIEKIGEETAKSQEIFLTAPSKFPTQSPSFQPGQKPQEIPVSQYSQMSLKLSPENPRKTYVTSTVEVMGKVEMQSSKLSQVKLAIIPSESNLSDDFVADSEEDCETSLIEITRPVEVPEITRQTSVLQVPSSPGWELNLSP